MTEIQNNNAIITCEIYFISSNEIEIETKEIKYYIKMRRKIIVDQEEFIIQIHRDDTFYVYHHGTSR